MNEYFTSETIPEKPVKQPKTGRKADVLLTWSLRNGSWIFTVILLAAAVFILFVATLDISGTAIQEKALSAMTVFLAVVSYLLYVNGYSIGADLTAKAAAIKEISDRYAEKCRNIRESRQVEKIDEFCKWYKERELREARGNILLNAGFKIAEAEEILNKTFPLDNLDKRKMKAIDKAFALKPIRFDKSMLISPENRSGRRNPIASVNGLRLYTGSLFIKKFIMVILTSVFAVSVGVNIYLNRNLETIIAAIIQLVILIGSIIGGMSAGRRVKMKYAERTAEVINVLDEFSDWCATKINEKTTQN